MNKYIFIALLAFLPFGMVFGATDYYLKLDGVKGETSTSSSTSTSTTTRDVSGGISGSTSGGVNVSAGDVDGDGTDVSTGGAGAGKVQMNQDEQEGSTDALLEIKGVDGETKKGNVEMNWKVEEGEKGAPAPGVEPDEIDLKGDDEPLTPDFSILLGGEGSSDDKEGKENRSEVATIVLLAVQEEGVPAEQLSLNFEKIKTKVKQPLKLFGFIPVSTSATVEIDAQGEVETKYPWWSFLASGKDGENLGSKVRTAISNVLKTRHDTIKNSIGNIR